MKDEILTDHLYFLSTCKELYNRAKSGYTDCPRVVVWTSENDIAQAGGEGNIYRVFHGPYHDPNGLRLKVVVRFDVIGEIVDNYCLNFLFIE
jgi:hypothetical protein